MSTWLDEDCCFVGFSFVMVGVLLLVGVGQQGMSADKTDLGHTGTVVIPLDLLAATKVDISQNI